MQSFPQTAHPSPFHSYVRLLSFFSRVPLEPQCVDARAQAAHHRDHILYLNPLSQSECWTVKVVLRRPLGQAPPTISSLKLAATC